jgi:hypothetical protein
MTAEVKIKICFNNGTIKKFELSQYEFKKFLDALDLVDTESFILNGITFNPKEIESIWSQVYPILVKYED